MKIRVVMLALAFASTGLAQPEQPAPKREDAIDARTPPEEAAPDDEQIKRETLEAEVEMLRNELKKAEAEVDRLTDQLVESAPAPEPVPGVYSPAVGNAISDLADCEQQLISGDAEDVEQRLVKAQAVLPGPAAAHIEEARAALARGDKGNARASLAAAIAAAQELY